MKRMLLTTGLAVAVRIALAAVACRMRFDSLPPNATAHHVVLTGKPSHGRADRGVIHPAERRATEVREQILALSRELVGAREAGEACSLFDALWDTLSAREQARILHLLIERVDCNGAKGSVSITFHPTGIRSLVERMKQKEAMA